MKRHHAGRSRFRFPTVRRGALWVVFCLVTIFGAGGCGPECTVDADCDDGIFCNGVESCDTDNGTCVAISSCPPSIPPTVCNEETDTCDPAPCTSDADCDDGLFCNGIESCDTDTGNCVAIGSCPPSIPPTMCNEETDTCDPVPCTVDADCDDGIFCNGVESCDTDSGSCVAISSCPPTVPPTVCNEETDTCDPA